MRLALQFDYTAVGHVTVDVLSDGTRRPGGSAFYSALQAARLGRRALILTQGVPREIEELLEPYREELELRVRPARDTTTLQTSGWGPSRRQRMLTWAGPIADQPELDTAVLHLAPIARETPRRWRARGAFVGLTPQGEMREWSAAGGELALAPAPRASERVAARCDALVLSRHEQRVGAALIERARDGGALVAVTAESRPTLLMSDGPPLAVEVPPIERPIDDLGAGDVFAAAFFVALADDSEPTSAVAFATAAAAVRIQGAGASAIGDREAIERRLLSTSAEASRAGSRSPTRLRSGG